MKVSTSGRMGWLVAVLALALLPGAIAQQDKDLLGYWPFDEGTGATTRDQAGKNDLELVGNPVWTKNASGYCLLFDGSNERFVYGTRRTGAIGYRGSGIIERGTISVWARPVDGGLAQPNPGDQAGRARVVCTEESTHVGICDGRWCGLAYDHYRVEYIMGPPVVNDQWTHLAMTWNEVFARFYVNGREIIREEGPYLRCDISGAEVNTWYRLYVSFPKHRQMFKGYVDDWKLFKRVLTPEEITAEYDREKDKRSITASNANDKTRTP